ncbi:MAG: hypothetical protein KDD62_12900, partial [Bdellovibrionales bacterium]|nr:hypothetical protein [Bdellovibrionales bacterium]
MAEEELENKEGEENAQAKSAGGKKKLILIVVGLVLLLVLIGAPVAYFALSGEAPPKEESVSELPSGDDEKSVSMEGESDEDEWDEDEEALGAIFPLDTFVVNL